MSGCVRHPFEAALTQCARCDDRLCATCWVEAKRKILCVDCALAMAGVRSGGRSGRTAATQRRKVNRTVWSEPLQWDEIDLREWKDRGVDPSGVDLPATAGP